MADLLASMILDLLVLFLVILTGILVLTGVHHLWSFRRLARRQALAAELRPRISRLVVEDEPDTTGLIGPSGFEGAMIEEVAELIMVNLRGSDRKRLQSLLARRGTLATAKRKLRHPLPSARIRSAELLAISEANEYVTELTALLDDRSPYVREAATLALGRLGDPAAVGPIVGLLDDDNRGVPGHTVRMALYRIGHAGGENLIRELTNKSAAVRTCAAETLGHLGVDGAVPHLADMAIAELDTDAGTAAVGAIDRIGTPQSTIELTRVANQAENEVVRSLAEDRITDGADNVVILRTAS